MLRPWHSLALPCAFVFLSGCYLAHQSGEVFEPTPAPRPAPTPAPSPEPPSTDAGPGPALTCEDHLAGARLERCDEASFGICERSIAGVECCHRGAWCEDGRVVESVICDDDCAQGCSLIERPGDCFAYGCEWFVSNACVDEPDETWVLGPTCLEPRAVPCDGPDDACPGGQVCLGFPYDPCAGSDCEACMAVAYWCTSP